MKSHALSFCFVIVAGLSLSLSPLSTNAQTSCLSYPSNSTPPSGYGASWDVFDSTKALLVKTNCPTSGTTLTLTIGKGDTTQAIYNQAYSYRPDLSSTNPWSAHTVTGTFFSGSTIWLSGQGTTSISAPASASATAPMYTVGYVCTNRSGTWKCGCDSPTCATGKWQIQGYKGVEGGSLCGNGMCEIDETIISCVADCHLSSATGASTNIMPQNALCIPTNMNGRTISVTDSTTLIGALLTAQPSDTIFLEDGTYNGNFTLAQSGKPRHPIVIRARTLHGALFGGKFTMSGDYGVLDGLRFSGPSGGVSIDGGDRNRVTRGLFRGFTSAAIQVRGGASYNRIDHNDIASPPQDTDDGSNKAYGIRVILKSGDQNTTSNIIDRNYIHDFPTRISSSINGHEAIQIGEGPVSTDWNIGTLIENNLLADVNLDSEALSLKASGNVVKGNTLTNSQAFLSNRHGYNNHWISNYVYQSVGLRVYGDDTRLIGNTMDGASLNILAGDTNQTAFSAQKSSSLTNSPAARNTLIVGNQGPIVVGYSYASKPTHIVQNTRLEANKSIAQRITGNETGTIELKETSITYIPAVRLTNQDVGPNSPDTACVD